MSVDPEERWLTSIRSGQVQEFFAELGVTITPAGSGADTQVRCFANPQMHQRDDRTASCSVNLISGLWHCFGCGERGNAYQAAVILGCGEQRARRLAQTYGLFLEKPEKPKLPGERQTRVWRQRMMSSPLILDRLADTKGWTREAIRRLGLGWDGERITFVARGPKGKIAGVARYLPGGNPKMVAIPGSNRGLFPMPEIQVRDRVLFIVEGEPATVSVRSCQHQAIGVPGVGSWKPEWADRLQRYERLVMLPDCDSQGRELAHRMSSVLPQLRVVDIDPAAHDGTDIGDWVAGAHHDNGLAQMTMLLDRLAAA